MGARRVAIITLGVAAACAGRAPEPLPSAGTSGPAAPPRVVVAEQRVEMPRVEGGSYVVLARSGADVPWPSPTVPLATGAPASAIAALARPVFASRDAEPARTRLLAAMDAHPDPLTADGLYLRVVLTAIRDEDRWDAATEQDPAARPSFDEAAVAAQQFLDRFPDDPHRPEVHYVHAWATAAMATSSASDDARAAAQEYLAVAAAAPDREIAIDADMRAGDYFFLDDGRHDALVLAAQAYGALVDSAQPRADRFRAEALARLGEALGRLGDPARARARLCALHAIAGKEAEAEDLLAETFDEAGDVGALRAACEARSCPCLAPVAAEVAEIMVADDDPPRAREAIDLVLAQFPDSPRAGSLRCARSALDDAAAAGCPARPPASEGSDVDRAIHELRAAAGVPICAQRAWLTTRHNPAGAATYEVTIGARGEATAVHATRSTLPAAETACVAEALARHRWRGLDGRVVALPLRIVAPD